MTTAPAAEPAATRVLVVDDSALVRKALVATFAGAPGFRVVGEAATGADAIARVAELRPDLVTMDLEMPDMDGLAAIERIMADTPTPILVVTGERRFRGLDAHFEALARGAVELVAKPEGFPVAGDELRRLLDAARLTASVPVVPHVRAHSRKRRRGAGTSPGPAGLPLPAATLAPVRGRIAGGVIVVGASTGGPGALRDFLGAIRHPQPPPVVVVQHMAEPFGAGFVRWLASAVPLAVEEARAGERLRPGRVYVAARGPHVKLGPGGVLELSWHPAGLHRPAVDELFRSAAAQYGSRALGIVMTGMGSDGAAGLAQIAVTGGLTAAQDQATSTVFGMPGAAIACGAARVVASPAGLARLVDEAAEESTTHVR